MTDIEKFKKLAQVWNEKLDRMSKDELREYLFRIAPTTDREVDLTEEIEKTWPHVWLERDYNWEVVKWLDETISGRFAIWGLSGLPGTQVFFEFEKDAMAFKMRWC